MIQPKLLVPVVLALIATSVSACSNDSVGFIDKKGHLVVDLEKYNWTLLDPLKLCAWQLGDYSDDMVLVLFKDGKQRHQVVAGYLDENGTLSLLRKFSELGSFNDGLAPCRPVKDGPWGFINKQGTLVIPAIYDHVHDFSDGLAAGGTPNGWILIDKTGKQVIKESFEGRAPCFSDGIAMVMRSGKWGCIDRHGASIVKSIYEQMFPASCGVIVARSQSLPTEDNRTTAKTRVHQSYFDKTGKLLFDMSFDAPCLRYLTHRNGRPCLIEETTEKSIRELDVEDTPAFREDLAAVQVGDKYGYVNKTGKVAIPAIYDYAFAFSDGMAMVYRDLEGGRLAYIDHSGRQITPFKFFQAASFSEGLAVVRDSKEGGYYYIDKSGNRAIPDVYAYARSFRQGKARVGMPSYGASL